MKVTYDEFKKALKIVNAYKHQVKNKEDQPFQIDRETVIREIPTISVRLRNCLHTAGYLEENTRMKELNDVSVSNLRGFRGFGDKSIEELQELCFLADVELAP